MIASLATGPSRLSNFSTSQDCASTLSCLRELGVTLTRDRHCISVQGAGPSRLLAPIGPLDCGNSGSTMRLLAGILAGQSFVSTLTGDGSLRSRPMKRIIAPLELMGARVQSDNGRPPLQIAGTDQLAPINYQLPVASAQVKSCVLLAALHAKGRTAVIEGLGLTRDHTERMLRWFGVPLETRVEGSAVNETVIEGPVSFTGHDVRIPGDISSAAFLIAAAVLRPDSYLEIQSVGLNPTRTQFLSLLSSLGMEIELTETREECNEPVGTVRARGKADHEPRPAGAANSVRGSLIPQLIDELPLLAVVASQVSGGLEIRDAKELRFKETDRIAATVKNLRAMGVDDVEEYEDGLAVGGPARLRGALIESQGDHRIAMAFTVAALLADGESEISGAECVGVSFPEFFELLDSVVER